MWVLALENFKWNTGKIFFIGCVSCEKLKQCTKHRFIDHIQHSFLTQDLPVIECRLNKAGLMIDKLKTIKMKRTTDFKVDA